MIVNRDCDYYRGEVEERRWITALRLLSCTMRLYSLPVVPRDAIARQLQAVNLGSENLAGWDAGWQLRSGWEKWMVSWKRLQRRCLATKHFTHSLTEARVRLTPSLKLS